LCTRTFTSLGGRATTVVAVSAGTATVSGGAVVVAATTSCTSRSLVPPIFGNPPMSRPITPPTMTTNKKTIKRVRDDDTYLVGVAAPARLADFLSSEAYS
jgi:hypothetical protein